MFALNWLTGFRGEDLNNFPIGSYVKTMSADGGHFEPRSGTLPIVIKNVAMYSTERDMP
jgi:hypothetical protein